MISKVIAFKASDGQIFNTLELVQRHEIIQIFNNRPDANDEPLKNVGPQSLELLAETIVKDRESVVDILTMTPRSKPKARSINGLRKSRTASVTVPKPAKEAA